MIINNNNVIILSNVFTVECTRMSSHSSKKWQSSLEKRGGENKGRGVDISFGKGGERGRAAWRGVRGKWVSC